MKKEDLKIVFFGTPDFAVESLREILDNGFNVCAVVTATDKIAGRGHKLLSSPVKNFAVERGLPVLQPEKLKDPEFIKELESLNADLFIVIAFRMLPEVVWQMPPLGTFNLHASLLPLYRGAAPINRAIMNGETKTGVTTFFLKHEIDTGDIIDRVEVDILPEDNAGDVHDRLMKLGAKLTVRTIKSIVDGTLKTIPQDAYIEKGIESTPAPKIFKETGHIDWSAPAEKIHNLVRGLSPYPGAWSILMSDVMSPTEIKILKTANTNQKSQGVPGTISFTKDKLYVNTGSNQLEVLEVQASGKKRMAIADYLRGARLVNPYFKDINS